MIIISGNIITREMAMGGYDGESIQRKVLDILISSNKAYEYLSLDQLKFELNLRANIVAASKKLNDSNFGFTTFRKSFCNTEYWVRTDEGGFLIKNGVSAYAAILDILVNSSKYGTECATAIVIVFYNGIAELFPEALFNNLFSDIYLMNWSNLDRDLDIADYSNLQDYLPGDCRYFKNPDVNPDRKSVV